MSTSDQEIQTLTKIYREHIWIDVKLSNLEKYLSEAELNQFCIQETSKYLAESLELDVQATFPSQELKFMSIAKLVNGFVLSVSNIKIAFIPSQDFDLMGFEVQREWVELSNWVADYYVPIQVDREHNYLHLWGFISHQYLLQRATFDRTLNLYEIEGADLIDNLDALWIACDLVGNGALAPERGKIPISNSLSHSEATIFINRLRVHQSMFSPRLLLPFEQWGKIINQPEYLAMYINSASVITKISNWFRSQVVGVGETSAGLVNRGWVTISKIRHQPEFSSGYFSTPTQKNKLAVRGIMLNNEQEIHRAVQNLYINQNPDTKVDLPTDIDSSSLLLVYLMQHTTNQTLRWQAAEYLWTIKPDCGKNWHRRIKDLGLAIQGHKLGLMVAAIPLLDGTYAVLNRVYSISNNDYLPPNVQLQLLSEDGNQLYQVESRSIVRDNYIQIYFTASVDNRFNVCVAMNNASITEAFEI
jgi:hypothetical protein